MTAIVQTFTLQGYKIINQLFSNEYVQLASQNLSFDFLLMAAFFEYKKLIKK